jgi:hypothetical protein
MVPENERHVRAFYDALVPGHRESVVALQAPDVVYEVPEGMPACGGRFEGIRDVFERFLPAFYGAFDVRFMPEEFVTAGDEVVAIGRLKGRTRDGGVPIDVPFVHVWTVREHRLERGRLFTDTAALARALGAGHG